MKTIMNRNNKTKRGNKYHIRGNKLATGISKTLADQGGRCKMPSDTVSRLSVCGTFDHLANGMNFYVKKIIKPHPTDFGYYKEVYVLTDMGKKRLKTIRFMKRNGMPFWEYMYPKN